MLLAAIVQTTTPLIDCFFSSIPLKWRVSYTFLTHEQPSTTNASTDKHSYKFQRQSDSAMINFSCNIYKHAKIYYT